MDYNILHEEAEPMKNNEQIELLFQVMDDENDVTLTDGEGVILRVSDSYSSHFVVEKEDVVGKTVYEMEELGIFKPSVTAQVLKEKRKVTLMQTNKIGEKFLTTGVPIFAEDGKIQYVISFNSIYIADMTTIDQQYSKLNELMSEYHSELNRLRIRESFDSELIAKSSSMENIREIISRIADTDANIMITGETGVGKSMLAGIIHNSGRRRKGPFIDINCGVIPESLIESELFGYERGSFTGASSQGKMGKIELANGGTLFLDEIGGLPLNMQLRFLQATQERTITRIGSLSKTNVDFRLVTATNHDLEKDVADGKFREDLFYRLNVIPIHIPPLRERPEDLIPLIILFLNQFNSQYSRNVKFSPETFDLLQSQSWPGNIRQVKNLVERIVITAKQSLVKLEDMPKDLEFANIYRNFDGSASLKDSMETYEKLIFMKAYEKYRTSISVAKALNISQPTAARRLRKYIPGYSERHG